MILELAQKTLAELRLFQSWARRALTGLRRGWSIYQLSFRSNYKPLCSGNHQDAMTFTAITIILLPPDICLSSNMG